MLHYEGRRRKTETYNQAEADAALELVSTAFCVHPEAIISKARYAFIVHCRHLIAYLLRQKGWTVVDIGAFLKRNHATISCGLKRYDSECERSEKMRVDRARLLGVFIPPA